MNTLTKKISVFGIGGAGCNAINYLASTNKSNWELVALNTDQKSLNRNKAQNKIHLGTNLFGTGGNPDTGTKAAEQSVDEIRTALKSVDTLIIICSPSGGTGGGVAPYIAKIANEAGAKVFAIALMPFLHEGQLRANQAKDALTSLRYFAATKVIENESINKAGAEFTTAFKLINQKVKAEIEYIIKLAGKNT